MAFPWALPAIIEGAAALSAALGLTAIATSNKNEHSNSLNTERLNSLNTEILNSLNTERLNNAFVQQNLPFMLAASVAKAKMQQPATTNIPTAENALVLRPEYRTVTAPIEALNIFGYKPIWAEGEGSQNGAGDGTKSGAGDGTKSGAGENPSGQDDEKSKRIKELEEELSKLKNKPKKSKEYYDSEKDLSWRAPVSSAGKFLFKSRGPEGYTPFRTVLEYSPIWAPIGYYGGKALGWWGEDNNNSSTEIDKEAYFKDSGGVYTVE